MELINPLIYNNWDSLLLNSTIQSFFLTTAWLRVLKETYNYKTHYFSIIENNELKVLVPVLEVNSFSFIKRGISLPFTDFCPIIIEPEYDFNLILNYIISYGKSKAWKYLEFRDDKYLKDIKSSNNSFYLHLLPLNNNVNILFNSLNPNVKRNIRKAERENIKIESGNSFEMLKSYYDLHCVTRKKHGIPPQPFKFFKNIFRYIILEKKGRIFLASLDNLKIAGMIFFHFSKESIYKFGASLVKYQSIRPNNLLMWEAIKFYSEKGYNVMNFGRTDIHHEGLRHFKKSWNTVESIHNYYKYNLTADYFVSKNKLQNKSLVEKMFKILPIPLLKIIGKLSYKHIA